MRTAGAAYTSTMEHRWKFDRPHGQVLLQAYSFFMGVMIEITDLVTFDYLELIWLLLVAFGCFATCTTCATCATVQHAKYVYMLKTNITLNHYMFSC